MAFRGLNMKRMDPWEASREKGPTRIRPPLWSDTDPSFSSAWVWFFSVEFSLHLHCDTWRKKGIPFGVFPESSWPYWSTCRSAVLSPCAPVRNVCTLCRIRPQLAHALVNYEGWNFTWKLVDQFKGLARNHLVPSNQPFRFVCCISEFPDNERLAVLTCETPNLTLTKSQRETGVSDWIWQLLRQLWEGGWCLQQRQQSL